MGGATGNYYCGLHEFSDMSFVLHYLRKNDLFVDIGANVGTYSILAAGCTGAHVISIEPIPKTHSHLVDNININDLQSVVDTKNIGLSSTKGFLDFSAEFDAENHVVSVSDNSSINTVSVEVDTLDTLMSNHHPLMIKIDVEGFEAEVLKGGERTFCSKNLEAVLIEFNGSGLRYGYSELDMREKFEQWGFTPCTYDPFFRRLNPLKNSDASTNGNTLYLRNIDSARERLIKADAFQVLGKKI